MNNNFALCCRRNSNVHVCCKVSKVVTEIFDCPSFLSDVHLEHLIAVSLAQSCGRETSFRRGTVIVIL